jgi:hypothetical protein
MDVREYKIKANGLTHYFNLLIGFQIVEAERSFPEEQRKPESGLIYMS